MEFIPDFDFISKEISSSHRERLENVKVEKDFWLPAPGPQEIVHRKEICRVKINISDRRRERRQAEKK